MELPEKFNDLSSPVRNFWIEYLTTVQNVEQANSRFYEAYRIGHNKVSANEGAALILSGTKTATSSLLWEYEIEDRDPPAEDELNIILNGSDEPVCLVETVWLKVLPFKDVDEAFAREYGEWDRTLATWREKNWAYFVQLCEQIGHNPSQDMPLICERFKVVYPPEVRTSG